MKSLMKSVLAVLVMSLFSIPTFAGSQSVRSVHLQDTVIMNDTIVKEDVQKLYMALHDDVIYTEIELSEVPEIILKAVADKYSGFSVSVAAKGSDETYKLHITDGSKNMIVIFDVEGEVVSEEQENMIRII